MVLIKKTLQELSPKILWKMGILTCSFLLFNFKRLQIKLSGGRAGMLTGHRCVVPSEMPLELADTTQELWEGCRYPSTRAVRGQASYLRVSHVAPDMCGQLNLAPRTYSFTDFNGSTSICDA